MKVVLGITAQGSETSITQIREEGASTPTTTFEHHWEAAKTVGSYNGYAWVEDQTEDKVYRRDLYQIEDHPSSASGDIYSVTVHALCQTNSTSNKMKCSLKSGTTIQDSAEKSLSNTNEWENLSETWDQDPNTGNSWTWNAVDALEVGLCLYCTSALIGTPDIVCDQVYAEVFYSSGVISDSGIGSDSRSLEEILFEDIISPLSSGTTYYFRAKVCLTTGWNYGEEKSFVTGYERAVSDSGSGYECDAPKGGIQ